MTLPFDLAEHVDNFRRSVLADAIQEASAIYWNRRADSFDKARPRPGDYAGQATRPDLNARRDRCTDVARACRARASVSLLQGDDIEPELLDVLAEVA